MVHRRVRIPQPRFPVGTSVLPECRPTVTSLGDAVRSVVGGFLVACCLTPVLGAQSPNLRAQIPGLERPVLLDSIAIKVPLAGPADRVVAVINEVYALWDLPIEGFDAGIGRLPNRRVTRSRRLGKTPMSRYLDCGRGFSGDNANIYRITLATAAWPEPMTGEATAIRVALIAGGQDPAGSRSGYVLCTTRGNFEQEFAEQVKTRLATPR